MCCYDWGATHTVGYVDSLAYEGGEKEYSEVKKELIIKKGFEMMNLEMPKKIIRQKKSRGFRKYLAR